MKVLLLFSAVFFLFTACSEPKTLVFKTGEINLLAAGPLFEGANTAQGLQAQAALLDFLKQHNASPDQIQSAKLTKALLVLPGVPNSSLLSEVTLQLAADKVDMQKVAVLNPVPAESSTLELQVAQAQDKIAQLLQEPSMTVVADVNLRQDTAQDLTLKAILEFQLTVNQ